MWQKFVAGACVMTGALGFGWSLCGEMNSDIRHLKQQKQILLNISGEITYLHRPMEEIFDIIADKAEMPYDLFLRNVSQGMKARDGKSLVSIWNAAVRDRKNGADLSQIAITYLEKMGNCFEYEGERLQVEALRLFEREIDSVRVKSRTGRFFTCEGLLPSIHEMGMKMEVSLIFKIAAVGILITILGQVLKHSGREEHAFLISLAGLVLVLSWIVPYIYQLFEMIQDLFAL